MERVAIDDRSPVVVGDTIERCGLDEPLATVDAGEIVRFPPGEFQSGRNAAGAASDERSEMGGSGADPAAGDGERSDELVVLALGAPKETDDTRIPLPCPDCGATEAGPPFEG